MSDKKILEELEKNLPAPVYLFHGIGVLVEEFAAKVVKRLFPEGADDFNYNVFHASTSDPDEIINTANTLPFMAPRRLVVVKEAGVFKAAQKKTFERYLADPSPTTCLLFLTEAFDKRSAFLKLLTATGCKSFQISVSERQMPIWVRQRAADLGIKLTSDAHKLLLDLIGPDLAVLSMELEKLYLSENKSENKSKNISDAVEIGVEQVEEVVGNVREYTPFSIVEAIKRGNIERALRIMKALRESGQDAVSMLGIIGWHYRQMFKREQNKKGSFKNIFEALHYADVELKTSGKPESLILESLLFKLLGPVA